PTMLRYLEPSKTSQDEDFFENRIWIPDPDIGYRLASVLDDGLKDILVGFRDDQGFFEKKRIARDECEPTTLNSLASDLCQLTEPNAATVLDSLKRRYQQNVIHTYCGLFCVVLNPWRRLPIYANEVMSTYRNGLADGYPHIYVVAQSAYDGILRGGRNQSILITGESGAGKTENTKRIIEYVLQCGGSTNDELHSLSNGVPNGKSLNGCSIGSGVLSSGILLEAFGNAKTTHNNNSSRFGKFIRIEFDENGQLQSAQIECYLLEKSRVVNQDKGNRNFHVFYQLLSNAFPYEMREKLLLTKSADQYKFLNQGGVSVDKEIDDVENGVSTDRVMDRLSITSDEKIEVYTILAACLLIGEIKFGERSGLDISYVDGKAEIDAVTSLLGVKSSRLVDALTQPSIRVGDKVIRKNQNMQKSVYSAAALAKVLYERLFRWLLDKCNDAINVSTNMLTSSITSRFIGVLDIAGFEIMQKNSFEQLCINYTNEKLQAFFNHFMFVREQSEYLDEGIRWTQSDFALDLQPTIDIIEKPLGLLSLLEEECVVPNGSDQSLLQKLLTNLGKHPEFRKAKQSQRCQDVKHFTIKHYAGSVDYNIDSWVEKNRDVVENAVLEVMGESTVALIRCLFPPGRVWRSGWRRHCGAHVKCAHGPPTLPSLRGRQIGTRLVWEDSSTGSIHRLATASHCKGQICIQSPPTILSEVECMAYSSGIDQRRQLYPFYSALCCPICSLCCCSHDAIEGGGEQFLRGGIALPNTSFDVDANIVVECLFQLEAKRRDYINMVITALQARIRSINMQRDCHTRRKRSMAICTIQNNVRAFTELANWSWFRIFALVRPLIPKERHKERIRELELLNEQLQVDNNRLHDQNLKLSTSCDLLREKVDELEQGAEETRRLVKEELAEKNKEIKKIREEMQQNEDVFELLEKKYDEQHQKVMKMNESLREYERKLDQVDMQKQELAKELAKLRTLLEKEQTLREKKEKECDEHEALIVQLKGRVAKLIEEADQWKLKLTKAESELEDEKSRSQRQMDTITELQKNISELNEKITKNDSVVLEEKNLRRKMEREYERTKDDHSHSQATLTKLQQKYDVLKEECRRKDNEINRLEKKLEDKEIVMADCVRELKEQHKIRVNELEERLAEVKRKNSKLESENKMQKMKMETRFERESSVDSDYGRSSSGRLSNVGRQYSLTSLSSLSCVRSFNRRMTESDMSTSVYSPRRRGDSQYDLSNCGLQRAPSTSSLLEKDKKISELERQLSQSHTEQQIMKRELDVYKTNLSSLEQEKECLMRQHRSAVATSDDLRRQLAAAEAAADGVAERLRRAQTDADNWKKKYEDMVQEAKNDILKERKRTAEKLAALQAENALRATRRVAEEANRDNLRDELARTQAELDRAMTTIRQLEGSVQSQETLGDTLEAQYRNILIELETARDENSALKTKIRRQYKQIELLTQQDETNCAMSTFQDKLGKL
ncbi:hypothetical protein Angca_003419, partial [Angiostrongylus cantonensis]